MNREFLGELISEALAVFIIIAFGDSVAAMYLLYDPSPYLQAYWGVCIVWGLGVTVAIYATGSVSGTHANPAVTLALATYRAFPWKKVVPYWLAQTVGGFLGAGLVYALYYPVINHFNDVHQLTRAGGGGAGVFFTAPGLGITVWHAFSDEIILTAILVFGIFAITEQYNEMAPGANFGALIIGFLVAAIGASMGYLEAWAINPARDLGPRLFAYMAGWHEAALPAAGHYWWVPVVGPLIGGLVGATAYEYLVFPFLPAQLRAQKARQSQIDAESVIIGE
ncbi:MIP/aquaporin family protein [Komagataeibacter xylinus]|uniref:Aquaporin family protein n=1 Tax=Komagataeibacter xylinus TaxID=28448 RepID=A0A857FVQ8_KOMXY|nr:MIP/aquaporin family protein [Komagataeibacter xylinus]QHC36784.1 aquaporin family protein [Komagataeibacter xylinus]